MKQIKLNVPYHSQFLEVEDHFWNIRSCGGTCIKMCLDYYNVSAPSVLEIMQEALKTGGYDMSNGFVHDWAVNYFKNYNLESYRKEELNSFVEIKESLEKGDPVIVSVTKKTLEQNKFHLLLVVGYEYEGENENKNVKNVIYHEPESTAIDRGMYRVCDIETFMNSFRGKAIFVWNK